jgi:enoyl-CoA hydratase
VEHEELLIELDDGVGTLTLNRPAKRNALSADLMAALAEAVVTLDEDPAVRALVLTGADPAFSAGFDLRNLGTELAGTRILGAGGAAATAGLLPPHDTPVIGAINGPAVTGGLELALSCDFLIASQRASFADTHARVGVMPAGGMTIRLPELIGVDRARRMSLTGDFVDAATAFAWGLVVEVVPHEQLLERARVIARSIASIDAAPVAELRRMYDEIGALAGPEAYERERRWNRAWMRERFSADALAERADDIIERGRRQV